MRWLRVNLFPSVFLSGLFLLAFTAGLRADSTNSAASPVTGHVSKVLPLFLDEQGRVSTSPSLYDRDAYQHVFEQNRSNLVTGIRFDVCWTAHKASGLNLKVRLEGQGIGAGSLPTHIILEQTVTPKLFHHWTTLTLDGTKYKNFGTLVAWRATLWNGDQLLGEEKSFLW
jgi:hypothetical protein